VFISKYIRALFYILLIFLLPVFTVAVILGAPDCISQHCIYLPVVSNDGIPTGTSIIGPTSIFPNTSTPTPTLTPTNTSTPSPTLTPTNTSAPSPTSTPTNTSTPRSTLTPTKTPTATSTGTPTQTPTSTPVPKPLFEQFLILDGVDDYALARDESSLDLGSNDFTLETFFYVPDQNNDSIDFLLYKYLAYNIDISYSTITEDRIFFTIYSGADFFRTPHSISYKTNITNGWHHIATSFDYGYPDVPDQMYLYFDGTLVASATSSEWQPFSKTNGVVAIGATDTGFNPFIGRLDEVRISSVIRYTGNTYAVPNAPFVNDDSTLALWHFDEQTGATVFGDVGKYNNILTGYNGAQTGSP
jgi:hypothetical protein